MASTDWALLSGALASGDCKRGVTVGIAPPDGGGSFVYGMNSIENVAGVVALNVTLANFAPMLKGGRVTGALKRGVGGAPTGFAPFLFIGLDGSAVSSSGYILGLADEDPCHIVLRKGALVDGLPDDAPDPDTAPNILMRSTDTFAIDSWHHLRLDMIVQGTGDVILQVFRSDLNLHAVGSPVWAAVPGMEGPFAPAIEGFVDDALGVNTGSVPFTSGRVGFGSRFESAGRRAFMDHVTVDRQL